MISKPYEIIPTMPMYNQYIKNRNLRQMVNPALRLRREAKPLFQDSYRAYRNALNAYRTAIEQDRETDVERTPGRSCLVTLHRELERARIRRARNQALGALALGQCPLERRAEELGPHGHAECD